MGIIKMISWFYVSENQNKRKIQTESKTHQDKNLKINSIQVMQKISASKPRLKF